MMNKISAVFGSHVFSDQVMRERLPKEVYKSLKATIDKGEPLDTSIADSSCSSHEGMGNGAWCNTLYTLVPATYRDNSREARLIRKHSR